MTTSSPASENSGFSAGGKLPISSERTLEAFYERIDPWADPFMALFGRNRLPARSTLSRFLASLD